MADKPKFIPITDEAEADLLSDPSDLSVPYTVKPNGHLWAEPDQLSKWRKGREQ
jgi:hypothetical protein